MELLGAVKEYRVRAYFTAQHNPRDYRWKSSIATLDEAKQVLEEAKQYYSSYKTLDKVVLEERYTTSWEESDD